MQLNCLQFNNYSFRCSCQQPASLSKIETLLQVFSCEFCEIFKNIFFTDYFRWLLLELLRFSEFLMFQFHVVAIGILFYKFLLIYYTFLSVTHCVKSVWIRSFFWSVFSCIWTEYGDLLSLNAGKYGKYGPEKTPYLDNFRAKTMINHSSKVNPSESTLKISLIKNSKISKFSKFFYKTVSVSIQHFE